MKYSYSYLQSEIAKCIKWSYNIKLDASVRNAIRIKITHSHSTTSKMENYIVFKYPRQHHQLFDLVIAC